MVYQVKDDDDFKKQIAAAGGKVVIIDFTASWCGPCKHIAPVFSRLADENSDIVFLKVDVDECSGTSEEFGVRAMPTFMVLVNGSKKEELCGANEEKLVQMVQKAKSYA